VTVATTSTPNINIPVKKIVKKVIPPVTTPSPVLQLQTSVVSNSSNDGLTVCPLGYTCSPIVQITTSSIPQLTPIVASPTPLTDQQMCVNSYGQNSVYTGNKNSNGGPVCGCANGYGWNNGQTSCQIQQSAVQQSPTQTVQTNTTQSNSSGNWAVCPVNNICTAELNAPIVSGCPLGYVCTPTTQSSAMVTCPMGYTCTAGISSGDQTIGCPVGYVCTPVASQALSPTQQVACQQAYDLAAASLQLGYKSQSAQLEAKLQQDILTLRDQTTMGGGGELALEQGLTATKDRALSSLTAQYGLNVSNEQMALQKCLNN
jgi:hypothetical protein